MAAEENTQVLSAVVSAAVLKYRFVKLGSDGKVSYAGVDARANGVSQSAADAADKTINMAIGGRPLVEVGTGGCTAGSPVASGANGVAVIADTGAMVLGVFKETGVAGDIVSIIFNPAGPTY